MDATQLRAMVSNGETINIPVPASALVTLLSLIDVARKRGETTNVEYWAEQCIIDGSVARKRAWKYSEDTRNRKDYADTLERLHINPARMSPAETVTFLEVSLKHGMNNVNADDVALAKENLKKHVASQQPKA